MTYVMYALIAVISYFLGNFTTGVYVTKWFSATDIRKVGSGNPGTTNVLRTLGWLPSVLTLLGDVLKGVLGALIGYWLAGDMGARIGGLFAVAGHNWPVFAGFKGGKGIATSLGVILVIEPWFALALVVVEFAVICFTKCVSLASISAAIFYLVITCVMRWQMWGYIAVAALLTAMALFSHRANIQRLLNGTENRLDFHKINAISKNRKK